MNSSDEAALAEMTRRIVRRLPQRLALAINAAQLAETILDENYTGAIYLCRRIHLALCRVQAVGAGEPVAGWDAPRPPPQR